MERNMWTGFFVAWICVHAVTADDESIFSRTVVYPPSWLQRCSVNGSQDIPIFREKGQEFIQCLTKQVNFTVVQQDLQNSYDNKNMTHFLKNICTKRIGVENCIDGLVSSVRHCIDSDQLEQVDTTVKVIKTALGFVCYREGERVLIFLKYEGVSCFSTNVGEITECANKSFQIFKKVDPNTEAGMIPFKSIKYTNETCEGMHETRTCMVNVMSKCTDKEPSNVVDSLLKAIIQATPCWNGSQATTAFSIGQLLVMAFLALLLSRGS